MLKRTDMNDIDEVFEKVSKDLYLTYLFEDAVFAIKKAMSNLTTESSVVEVGAAGGITKLLWPSVKTTDVRLGMGVDSHADAQIEFAPKASLDGIFGIDTLHHIVNPMAHFHAIENALKVGGQAVYIDPNFNLFSKFVFKYALKYIHQEPYDSSNPGWELPSDSVLIGNQAQIFNIFIRDQEIFQKEFPNLHVQIGPPLRGISYLISGGVSSRLPISSKVLISLSKFENKSKRWMAMFGLSRLVIITKLK